VIELEDLFDDEQLWLLGRTKLRARLAGLRVTGTVSRSRFSCFLRLFRQRLDQRQRLLQLLTATLELAQFLTLAREGVEQLLDLDLLRHRDPAQLLDVFLAAQIHAHRVSSIQTLSIPSTTFFQADAVGVTTCGDNARRPTISQPSTKSASSLAVKRITV